MTSFFRRSRSSTRSSCSVLTPFTDVIEIVAAAYAITGFLVGVFGSLLSIRKFLKV